jgi:hypothetical protein
MAVPITSKTGLRTGGIPIAVASRLDEAPALSSSRALVRFEFKLGKGNEGTKILKVEWSDSGGPTIYVIENYQLSYQLNSCCLCVRCAGHKSPCSSVFSCALRSSLFFVIYILVNIFSALCFRCEVKRLARL